MNRPDCVPRTGRKKPCPRATGELPIARDRHKTVNRITAQIGLDLEATVKPLNSRIAADARSGLVAP